MSWQSKTVKPDSSPKEGRPLPDFRLRTLAGQPYALSTQLGRLNVLYFFCGCAACLEVATEWNRLAQAGVLTQQIPELQKTTIVYVDLSQKAAEALAESMGWDPRKTTLLLDKDNTVRDLYRAEPCPRVFVTDKKLVLRYTNSHNYDAPQKAPSAAIVAFTMDALKKIQPMPRAKKELA